MPPRPSAQYHQPCGPVPADRAVDGRGGGLRLVLGTRLPNARAQATDGRKEGPYESGIAPRYQPTARFPVRFYLIAMIFIIFDIEIIFLYPWAVMYHQLGTFGLAEMGTFAVVVFIAFAYLVSNGALDWGPRRREGGRPPASVSRVTEATVLRVPRPEELYGGVAPRAIEEEGEKQDDVDQPVTPVSV